MSSVASFTTMRVELVGGPLCGDAHDVPREELKQHIVFAGPHLRVRAASRHKKAHTNDDLERVHATYRFVAVWPATSPGGQPVAEYWHDANFPVPEWKIAAKDR